MILQYFNRTFFFFRHKYLNTESVKTVYPMVRFIWKTVCSVCPRMIECVPFLFYS